MTWKASYDKKSDNDSQDSVDIEDNVQFVDATSDEDDETSKQRSPDSTSTSPASRPRFTRPRVNCCDTKSKRIAWGIVIVVLIISGIAIIATSLNKLESTEYGVQYNTHSKQLDEAAKSGGLHVGVPGFEFIKFPSVYIDVDLPESTCVSRDGLRVAFAVSFQYQLPRDWVVPTVIKYRDFDQWANVVEAAGNSAVQHTCSAFNITSFQNQRGIIQATMQENLSLKLEGPEKDGAGGVYARAISLQLRNVDLPDEYRNAVHEKQAAKEDIELAKNQRTQEITKARTELLAAKEEARKILDTAINNANITLTEARLKAEETIYAFQKESETIVGVKDSLGLTTDGVLAYLSNQLVSKVPNLKVTTAEPAKLSRKDEL